MSRRGYWIQLAVAVVLVTVGVFLFLDLHAMAALLRSVSPTLLLAVVLVAAADQTVMGLKWNLLLKTFRVHVPPHAPVLAYWRGRFLRLVFPANFGLDAYRAYALKRRGAPLLPVLSSIFTERFFGLLSSCAVIALLFPFALRPLGVPAGALVWPLAVAGFCAIWGLVLLAMRWSHLPGRLRRVPLVPARAQKPCLDFLAALGRVREGRGRVLAYFFVSNLEKLLYGAMVYVAARSLGLELGALYCVAAVPVIALLERLPISLGAIGVREGLYVILLAPLGLDQNHAVSVGLVVRAAEVLLVLLSLLTWIPGRRDASIRAEVASVSEEIASIETS